MNDEFVDLSRRDDLESLAYAIFFLYANGLPWSGLGENRRGEILKLKQVWREERSLQGRCEYPLGDLVYYAQGLDFDSEPEYDVWREHFWRVDNGSSASLPESDPLYDPADTTENVPRNMDFISSSFCRGKTFAVKVPARRNTGRMEVAPGSDHGYLPASSGWGMPLRCWPGTRWRRNRISFGVLLNTSRSRRRRHIPPWTRCAAQKR